MKNSVIITVVFALLAACDGTRRDEPEWTPPPSKEIEVRRLSYTVVKKYPHDKNAFTEGLLFHNGNLLESTGSPDNLPNTRSLIGIVDLATGKIEVKAELDPKRYFGEGIVVVGDKLYQVTWRSQKGFIYDANTFKLLGQFSYPNTEGWGLTTDGKHIIMSDGTFNLTWLDPSTMKIVKTLGVTKDGYGLDHINELEWINGYVYANVWMTNNIVKIDPETGVVVAEGDFTPLFNEAKRDNPALSEMNGIAFNPATGQILVTGKMWPWIYEINLNN